MRIPIVRPLAETIGTQKLAAYGIEHPWPEYTDSRFIDLDEYGPEDIRKLIALLEPHAEARITSWGKKKWDFRGTKTMIEDCKRWLRAIAGEDVSARTTEHFSALLRLFVQRHMREAIEAGRPYGPRWYRLDKKRGVWLCYYVERVKYWPAVERSRGDRTPAHVTVDLQWREFGGEHEMQLTFWPSDCAAKTVAQTLANAGFMVETAELWDDFQKRLAVFEDWIPKVGLQMLARGQGTDDCDGNPKGSSDSWYYRRTNAVNLEKNGEPSRVVIDVFYEDPSNDKERRKDYDRVHWEGQARSKDDEDEEYRKLAYDEVPERYMPTHCFLACFDMKRHMRLRIDVGQLEPYKYDAKLGDKLVLPEDPRSLIDMLMRNRGTFVDVVKGKSGGSIILSAGAPGTGKTLTAEVYSEVMGKPLYTVQASQLGLRPEELEEELLKCFTRAQRWDAIMLIDEADVYVAARGRDLQQNAIVGVFLRVLEYYAGVLFLTTNRSDLVDDAIASRCIARIDYTTPTPEDQRRIWNVLSATAGIAIAPEVIDAVVELYPDLSGRDVKNLLKLAQLVANHRRCDITVDVIRFVKRFKPTGEYKPEAEPINLPEVRKLQRKQTNG